MTLARSHLKRLKSLSLMLKLKGISFIKMLIKLILMTRKRQFLLKLIALRNYLTMKSIMKVLN